MVILQTDDQDKIYINTIIIVIVITVMNENINIARDSLT